MRAGAGRRRVRRDAASGFTLLEVMVALAVLSIGLALASRLVIESQLGLVRASAELGNGMPHYAIERLRSDLQQADVVPALMPVWRSSPLVIAFAAGSEPTRIRWERSETGDLERVILDNAGHPAVRHVALRDVSAWRWRPITPRLVDVEVIYRARDTSEVPLVDVARTWSPPIIDRVVWLRVGLRAEASTP
jgi:prepilin-type N-terminal cleavage/methylation domain-containing protein